MTVTPAMLQIAWGSSIFDSLPVGSIQCYDVDRLASDLPGGDADATDAGKPPMREVPSQDS